MRLTRAELDFLAAWAREEWEPACYQLPAHQLQMFHGVAGALFVPFIKAWTKAEGKRDQEITQAADNSNPRWPWSNTEEFNHRLQEAGNACQTSGAASPG